MQSLTGEFSVEPCLTCDCVLFQEWGSMMLFRGIDCPCLHIKHFVVTFDGRNKTYTKWSELAIKFPAFDYAEHASLVAHSSEEDDDSM